MKDYQYLPSCEGKCGPLSRLGIDFHLLVLMKLHSHVVINPLDKQDTPLFTASTMPGRGPAWWLVLQGSARPWGAWWSWWVDEWADLAGDWMLRGGGEGPWGLETHGSDKPDLFPSPFLHLTLGP